MARRISLPSSDELFGDHGPYAGTAPQAPSRPRKPRSAGAKPPTPPAKAARSQPRVMARIDRVEAGLRDLPIDTLLELRDGLEALLLSGSVSEADVERVLAASSG